MARQVTTLLATSSLAYTMVSFIDDMLSSTSCTTDIESLLDELFESQVTEDTAAKFQSQAAGRASRHRNDSMPTEREIEFKFIGLKLSDVVQDLNVEWELRFWSRLLATALRLPFEEWIFRAPTAEPSNMDSSSLRRMITARSLALDMLQDGTDTNDIRRREKDLA